MIIKFPTIEMFYSIQGEGKWTGIPCIFIRTTQCNLSCVFGNSICDTPYTSINAQPPVYETYDDVKAQLILMGKQHIFNNIVITGGEPLLWQKGIETLIKDFPNYNYTIETNGTIIPKFIGHENVIFSCSPKLSTSEDTTGTISMEQSSRHKKTRINPKALTWINSLDHYFKFVYTNKESINEIKQLINKYSLNNIYLMPEGTTREQLETKRMECIEECLKNGWNYSDRLHIIIWNDKKCV